MTSVHTKCEFLPRELWSRDPVYESFARLCIADIHAMQPYETSHDDAFAYKNHPICNVDIFGLVVSIAEHETSFSYAVDDGTGVIKCCCWKPQPRGESANTGLPDEHGGPEGELVASLQRKMEAFDEEILSPFQLGDSVHVRGMIKMYLSNKEVSACYFRKVEDPTFQTEIKRAEDLKILYQSVYDHPFRLDEGDEEEKEMLGPKHEAELVSSVQGKLHTLLELSEIERFYLEGLESMEELMNMASMPCIEYQEGPNTSIGVPENQAKNIFRKAVERLEEDGLVLRSNVEEGLFECTSGNERLNGRIQEVLRSDCQLPKHKDGCHYMHVVGRLRNMSGYEHIRPEAVQRAFDWLERTSKVISTGLRCYMDMPI